jgi:predicted component of type VI protein secretion system
MDYIRRMPSEPPSRRGPALQARGTTFPVSRRVTTVGRRSHASTRSPDIDLTEIDPQKLVSRQHARLLWQAGVVRIEDLGSLNGTFVGGKRLRPHQPEPLADGASVTLGGVPTRFVAQASWAPGVVPEWEATEETGARDPAMGADTIVVRRRQMAQESLHTPRARRLWPPNRWFR